MPDDDPMDVPAVLEALGGALALQWRSVLHHALLSASLAGPAHQAVAERLGAFAAAELDDARRLAAKVAALGGRPAAEPPALPAPAGGDDPAGALGALAAAEAEAIEALHAVIAPTGQEGRSEALEHLVEHVILRKQDQVDYLGRARGPAPPVPRG